MEEQLLSIRVETPEERVPPYGTDPRAYPRIVRIRDLLGPIPMTPIRELREFNRHVFHSEASPDGQYLLVEGLAGSKETRKRISKLLETPTGKEIGAIPIQLPLDQDGAFFRFDPTGRVLLHDLSLKRPACHLLAIPGLTFLRELRDRYVNAIGVGGKRWLGKNPGDGKSEQPAHTVNEQGRKRSPGDDRSG